MCHGSCLAFGVINLKSEDITGKSVIEVGSYNINGSLREPMVRLNPSKYVGVDITEGPCVDQVCKAEDVLSTFGAESFDTVISTEMMEHVENWKNVVHNLKGVCKKGGVILITTRSVGFPKHECPSDFWRYSLEDMKAIFSDCEILKLENDRPRLPGVFIKVRKPLDFKENDLSGYSVYGMK